MGHRDRVVDSTSESLGHMHCTVHGDGSSFFSLFKISGRHPMFGAAAASILIHAALIAATLVLMRSARRVPATDNKYIYFTLLGAGTSGGGYTAQAGQDHRPHPPRVPRDVARFRRAPRRVAKHLPRVLRLTPAIPESSRHVASNPVPSTSANLDALSRARPSTKDENHDSGFLGGASGDRAAGSVPGPVAYQAPVLLSRIVPNYPEGARSRGIEGVVVLQFIVDQRGRVEGDIEVVASLPMLDQAAIEAVRQWRFVPGRDRDGNPIRVVVRVPLKFMLR
jgi:periplasmic protein TonB